MIINICLVIVCLCAIFQTIGIVILFILKFLDRNTIYSRSNYDVSIRGDWGKK